MQRTCCQCQAAFEITPDDLAFYDKVSPVFNGKKELIPPPTLCPDCRQQRRLGRRNERRQHKRICDATKQAFFSNFPLDAPFLVYSPDAWYADAWNPTAYGRPFDFSRPFFEQFDELMRTVPLLGRVAPGNHNCDYTQQCGWSKNCYLIFEADYDENCLSSSNIYDSRMCCDLLYAHGCELCYESIDCQNCYNLRFSHNCTNCADSWFLRDCIGCRNCIGCVNMRNKEYCIFNRPYAQKEFSEKAAALQLDTHRRIHNCYEESVHFSMQQPHKPYQGANNEESSGDYLWNTQRCKDCYDVRGSQDCRFVFSSRNVKNVYDMTVYGSHGTTEFCYENHCIGHGVKNLYFCDISWTGCHDNFYCEFCVDGSNHLFGMREHATWPVLHPQ